MRKLYKLNIDTDVKLENNIKKFLDPEFIYLPIDEMTFFEPNEKILKNKIFLETKNYNYASSVSGKIVEIVNINMNNKKQEAFKIENDFQEQNIEAKKINNSDTNQFYNLVNKDYLFKKINLENVSNIVVNAIEDEPYFFTENYVLTENIDVIFDTLEFLMNMFKVKKCNLVLKNSDSKSINKSLSNIGSFPNVKLNIYENLYMIGNDKILLEKLKMKESNTLVLKPSEILEIKNYISFGYPKAEKYISIIDLITKKVTIYNLKKYISVKEFVDKYHKYDEDYVYVKNGIMTGVEIDINYEIIDDSFKSLVIAKKHFIEPSKCIKCGMCKKVCPFSVKKISDCVNCGLCSYFCPSKINLRKDK